MMFVTDDLLLRWMSLLMILSGVSTFVGLIFVSAPYGRYTTSSWGIALPSRVAWVIQELPSFVIPVYFIVTLEYGITLHSSVILLFLFATHYFQRTFIFPLLIRGGKPTPLITCLLALIFCSFNGYLQGLHHATSAAFVHENSILRHHFRLGVVMFFIGMTINIHSDSILRNLRRPGEKEYKIPRGGLFEYISGANFFGEIVEWVGFAIASWSLPATAFALFTVANIGPRAWHHHRWYKEKFPAYPKDRYALIPFLL